MLALLVFHGCTHTYSVVNFEVLEPATVNIPENVQQLLVINRAPFTFDAFEEEDRRGLDKQGLLIADTMIVNNLFRGLLHVLQTSPVNKFHSPLWLSERRTDTAAIRDLVLTRREVDALCAQYGVDAIISLELYSMDLDKFEDQYEGSNSVRTRYFELASNVIWNVYLEGYPKPFDSYTLIDTIFYTEVLDGLPINFYTTGEILRDGFFKGGMKYGRYLVPVWVPAARQIYRGRESALRLAARQTSEGNWDSAYSIWSSLTAVEDSTVVAQAYNNMAVYFELEDNLDSARSLVDMAVRYDSLELIMDYAEELDTRIENKKELYKQVK